MIRTALAASILATLALSGPVHAEPAMDGPADRMGTAQPITLGQPFKLNFGETAQVAGGLLSIKFDSVVEDSRCPAKVTCIWGGRVVVALTATSLDGPAASFQLQLGGNTEVLNYKIALGKVEPVKTEAPINNESYVLTLTVTPKPAQ